LPEQLQILGHTKWEESAYMFSSVKPSQSIFSCMKVVNQILAY